MLPPFAIVLCFLGVAPGVQERPSYLFHMDAGAKEPLHLRRERYHAQAGDVALFDDHSEFTAKVYRFCGTGRPLHVGIVFSEADGTLAILEAGTNAVMKVFIFELESRLHGFDGTILIRRLRTPLDSEQSKQLAQFAHAQEGKAYAIGRLALQATPFRPRSSLLAQYFGRTVLDRDRWICSELVVAAAANAGIWPRETYPANLMYPRDLCYDERFDLSPYYAEPALWYPREQIDPAGAGVRVGTSPKRSVP